MFIINVCPHKNCAHSLVGACFQLAQVCASLLVWQECLILKPALPAHLQDISCNTVSSAGDPCIHSALTSSMIPTHPLWSSTGSWLRRQCLWYATWYMYTLFTFLARSNFVTTASTGLNVLNFHSLFSTRKEIPQCMPGKWTKDVGLIRFSQPSNE